MEPIEDRWVGAVYAIVICVPIVLAHNASAAGNGLYVADGNRTVRFKNPKKNGGTEDLVLGQPDFTSNSPSTALSGMNVPLGVIFQPSSKTLWVADEDNSRVLGFVHGKSGFSNGQDADIELGNPDFSNINGPCNVSQNGLCNPSDVAFDSAGNLWVADAGGSRVLEFEPPFSTGQDASVVIGKPDFDSRGCSTPTQDGLCTPWSLAFDPSGNLWVLDGGNNRIVEYEPPFSNGQNASIEFGQPDFFNRICSAGPDGICPAAGGQVRSDKFGNIWEADNTDNRVIRFPRGSGFSNAENADVVLGQPDFTSASALPPSKSSLNAPWGLTFDSKGDLFVSQQGSCRVSKFEAKKGKFKINQNADLVIGQPNFTTGSCAVSQTTLQNPRGLSFGP